MQEYFYLCNSSLNIKRNTDFPGIRRTKYHATVTRSWPETDKKFRPKWVSNARPPDKVGLSGGKIILSQLLAHFRYCKWCFYYFFHNFSQCPSRKNSYPDNFVAASSRLIGTKFLCPWHSTICRPQKGPKIACWLVTNSKQRSTTIRWTTLNMRGDEI